ncbi:TRAP transporter substrate-binding protein DctP [Arthrobacter sp. NPDC089319]|uniref:TRAP transporter substrate-binding protein DctP n=1 Tax=Arthrobacter sp. NPDC089319 TaxID=3155915 RepID=UPI0034201C8F
MDPVVVKWADQGPDSAATGVAFRAFAEEVEEKTDGKVTFEYYWSAALLPGAEFLSGVGSGVADMAPLPPVYNPQELPVTNWAAALNTSAEDTFPYDLLQRAATTSDLFEDSTIQAEFEKNNLKVITINPNPSYNLACKEPIESLASLQGRKVRAAGNLWIQEAEALGMVPVNLPTAELYEGLQRGVVDCVLIGAGSMSDYGVFDVASHFVPLNASSPFVATVMNLDMWNSFSPELQDVFLEAGVNFMSNLVAADLEKYSTVFGDGGPGKDVTWYDAPDVREALAAYQNERIAGLAQAEGAPANAQEVLSAQEQSGAHWKEVLDGLDIPVAEDNADSIKKAWMTARDMDVTPFFENFAKRQ